MASARSACSGATAPDPSWPTPAPTRSARHQVSWPPAWRVSRADEAAPALARVVEAGEQRGDGGAARRRAPVDVDHRGARRFELGGEHLEPEIHDAERSIENAGGARHGPSSNERSSSGRITSAAKRAA